MTEMHAMHPEVVSYLQKSKEILAASDAVADALASSSPDAQREQEIDYTVESLKEAVARTAEYDPARKGFYAASASDTRQPLPIQDQLTIAAADTAVANVLFAASSAIGEQTASAGATPLRIAVQSAGADLKRLEPATQATQGFGGGNVRQFSSGSLAEAATNFQTQAKSAVDKIVEVSDAAVSKIFNALANQKDQILEAFSKADELFDGSSDVAVLLRSAWDKLRSALKTIYDIVSSASFKDTEAYLADLLGDVSVKGVLHDIFQSGPLESEIEALHVGAPFQIGQIDALSSDLTALEDRFAKMVGNIRTVTAIAAPLLSLSVVHFTGPFAPLAVPACYSLSIAAIVGLGLDFTRSGFLNSGTGIRKIVHELQPSPTVPQK